MSSSRRGWIAFQIETRRGVCEAGPEGISSISQPRHVFNWNFNVQLELLGSGSVDDRDGPETKRSFVSGRDQGTGIRGQCWIFKRIERCGYREWLFKG